MAKNKYCNLDGTKKIKDEFGKISEGFSEVEKDLENIIVTPAEGISEQEIIQARKGQGTLGGRLDSIDRNIGNNYLSLNMNLSNLDTQINSRIDNIISTPTTISEQEIIDAREGADSLGQNLRAIRDAAMDGMGVLDINFQRGSLNTEGMPSNPSITNRIRSEFFFGTAGTTIHIDPSVRLYVWYYDHELNPIDKSGVWIIGGSYTLTRSGLVRLLIMYNSDYTGGNDPQFTSIDELAQRISVVGKTGVVGYSKSMQSTGPLKLILGGHNYPIINSAESTITFPTNPSDMIIYIGGIYRTNVVAPNQSRVIDLNLGLGTSTRILLYNIQKDDFKVVRYDGAELYIPLGYVIFATFRKVYGMYACTMPCPYILDGKSYGTGILPITDASMRNVSNNTVKGVAHRGFSTVAPENTLPAYRLARENGFSYVECDVEWTSDNIPVLLHDSTIDRTSNGSGRVDSKSLAELKLLDFGGWKSEEYANTRIPTLQEFVFECKKMNLHAYIELKGTVTSTQASTVINIVKKMGMIDHVTWISFSLLSLQAILTHHPQSRVGYVGSIRENFISEALSIRTSINDVFINSNAGAVTQELAEQALLNDIPVEVWTVNNQEQVMGLVEKGISGITTDHLNMDDILGS